MSVYTHENINNKIDKDIKNKFLIICKKMVINYYINHKNI